MEIKVTSRETIKPSSPTPEEHKILKLSSFDQFHRNTYFPLILFYPNKFTSSSSSPSHVSAHLKNSLSEALTIFYPLAGRRMNDHFYISCNDEGAIFIEATVNMEIVEFLNPPKLEFLNSLLPCEPYKIQPSSESLPFLLVKVNTFSCGGIAIGLCNLHSSIDACSCCVFLKTWTAICRESRDEISWPDFSSAFSFCPPRDTSGMRAGVLSGSGSKIEAKCSVRRFVFDSKAINNLKSQAKQEDQTSTNPTRYQALSSFITKHMILATKNQPKLTSATPVVLHIVDIRRRIGSPFSQNSMGNLLWPSMAVYDSVNPNTDLEDLVTIMRENIGKLTKDLFLRMKNDPRFLCSDECAELLLEGVERRRPISFVFTSWVNLGFIDLDFGWGKPLWVGLRGDSQETIPNTVVITETNEGIEAWVTMAEGDMAVLEKDEDFLRFALLNPSVSNM